MAQKQISTSLRQRVLVEGNSETVIFLQVILPSHFHPGEVQVTHFALQSLLGLTQDFNYRFQIAIKLCSKGKNLPD